jgi:hypothetical protein
MPYQRTCIRAETDAEFLFYFRAFTTSFLPPNLSVNTVVCTYVHTHPLAPHTHRLNTCGEYVQRAAKIITLVDLAGNEVTWLHGARNWQLGPYIKRCGCTSADLSFALYGALAANRELITES